MTTPPDLHPCPTPEVLVLFLEGKLTGANRDSVALHVETCSECVFVMGETSRFLQEEEEAPLEEESPSPFYRGRRWWLAAAAALALIAGVATWQHWSARNDPVRQLARVAADAPVRPVDGRLDGFPHARFSPTRSPEAMTPALRAMARAVAEDREADLHARGIAELLRGNAAQAVVLLERASGDPSARVWSDLAAARIALAREDRHQLEAAIADANRALDAEPDFIPALFNRAVARERLGLRAAASADFARAAALEPESAWAGEASARSAARSR